MKKKLFLPALLLLLLSISGPRAAAVNYYWVGGSGNWSDLNHWATSSGGNTLQSIVPSVNDHVIFDAGSGFTAVNKTVTVDVTIAYCDSMTWAGSAVPATLQVNNPLQVNGSLWFQPGMTINGPSGQSASVIFASGRPNESITTGNNTLGFNLNMIFSGTGGWNLQDSLKLSTSSGSVTFTGGNLNFNGKYAVMYQFLSNTGSATRTLNIANSVIEAQTYWIYTGGAPLTAVQSAQSLIINRYPIGGAGTGFAAKAGDVYYNVQMLSGGISSGVYNKVTYTGGILAGSNGISSITADTLALAPSLVYYFQAGNTSTINKYFLAAPPACSGLTELRSSVTGTQSTITMAAGGVTNVANTLIKDMKIQGPSAPYTAATSVDLGNNTGWSFTASTPHTYYWVGGTGNWNDAAHWSLTSNGTGGACVPTLYDNVIFDAGSGFTAGSKTVTVDGNAYCDSMTWAGSAVPATFQVNNALQINGSLWFQPGMTINGPSGQSAAITFSSNKLNESITTGNNTFGFNLNVTFNGTGGWNLQDSLKLSTSSGSVNFTNGNLNFNGQYAIMYQFASSTGNATRTLNIANSVIEAETYWIYTGGVPLTAAQSAQSLIINKYPVGGASAGFTAKVGDVYYNVQMLGGGITNGTYNKVTYTGSILAGSNGINAITTDTLVLAPALVYYFKNGATTTINKYFLAATPPCSGLIELHSSVVGTQATIAMAAGGVTNVANALIKDIRIQGPSAPYTAVTSIDLGDNTGWNFTAGTPHTYYWVGGTGNWNDAAHWSLTSNGTGGACVPTLYDNVIFDAGSGFTAGSKTVTLDGNAYCDSMTWAGSAVPATFQVNNPLQINGSLELQPGMTITGSSSPLGTITFSSSKPNESITTGNNALGFNLNMVFNGTGGWNLQDSLKLSTSSGSLTFTNGSLNFNGKYAIMYQFQSGTGNTTRTLNIANSVIEAETYWIYTGGVPLTAAQSAQSLIINKYPVGGTGTGFAAKVGDVYYNVQMLGGGITNGTYNKVTYTGSMAGGAGINAITTDTLIFGLNASYYFTAVATSYINKAWYASGNPCFLNNILSTIAGTTASVSMPATAANYPPSTYGIDFVRLKDIGAVTGTGRATLQMGNQSIDQGNNSNWNIIPYAGPSGITGLGHDTTLYCNAFPYTLSTVAFMGNPTTTYLWYDATTAATHVENGPGSYSITVNYGNGCIIRDTIALAQQAPPTLSVSAAIVGANNEATLTAGALVGTPQYTLDSVLPAGVMTVPVTQASNVFELPLSVTQAYFHVTDETSGCMAFQTLVNVPLPVKLASFNGRRNGTDNLLSWTLQSETGIDHYELEAASDGKAFSKLATVAARNAGDQRATYNYTDADVFSDRYYRLRMVGADGAAAYSPVLRLAAGASGSCFELTGAYPSPFINALTLSFSSCRATTGTLVLVNAGGRTLREMDLDIPEGVSAFNLADLGNLPGGLYMLRVITANGTVVLKLVK